MLKPQARLNNRGFILLEIVVTIAIILGSMVFVLEGYGRIIRVLDQTAQSGELERLTRNAIRQLNDSEIPLTEGVREGGFSNNSNYRYEAVLEPMDIPELLKAKIIVTEKRDHPHARAFTTVTYLRAQ